MSNNKLTSMAPTLSLGVGPPTTFSLATSNFSTLTSPTQPLGASPLPLPPTQSLGAASLAPHTLNLSANTLNALNALNNPTQTLNALNTTNQALAALTPPAPGLNTLNAPSASPSSQPFLASQPMAGIVSLPQSFCFPSQPSQTSVSAAAANQATALGVTLGFPMAAAAAALNSNTVSLNTNTIPLNSSSIPLNPNTIPLNSNTIPLNSNTIPLNSNTIPLNSNTIPLNTNTIPLNSNTIPLNAGTPLSQQLVQSLSLGQQPGAICASLPQSLNFPLGQALLGMSNTAAASGTSFLSAANLGQFPGLPSVIMGGQQSVLQGALMGSSSPGQGASLQTIGTLNPQSLSFPLSTGPVITELPAASQSAEPAQEALPAASKPPEAAVSSDFQAPQELASAPAPPADKGGEPQPAVSSEQGSEAQPVIIVDPVPETQTSSAQTCFTVPNSAQSPAPQEKPPQTSAAVQEPAQQPGESESPAASELPDPCTNPPEEPSAQTVRPETVEVPHSPEIPPQFPVCTAEKERTSPATPQPQQVQPSAETQSSLSSKPASSEAQQPSGDSKDAGSESADCGGSDLVEESRKKEKGEGEGSEKRKKDEQCVEGSSETITGTARVREEQPMDVCIEVLDEIKQEVMDVEEIVSPPPQSEYTAPNSTSPPAPSPVKMEASSEAAGHADHHHHPRTYPASETAPCPPTSSVQVTVSSELLAHVKQEEEEDEVGLLPLPDSTPGGSEDSLDSYYQRHSPSPMASLQLTRADTTTTFTSAAYARPRVDDLEGAVDVKQLLGSEATMMDMEEPEFVWEEYLLETGASAVPPTAFKHVECSLQSGLTKGMRVEVANKSQPGTYWVASVVMTCGPLLRLRYEGYEEDGSEDFWCDLTACEIHPIGWCAENGVALLPPDGLKNKHKDWTSKLQEILEAVPAAPSYLLDKTTGTSPTEQLKQGMRLELQDADRPVQVWLVRIMENVGGRLYLRLEGMDSGLADFWAFYLHELLHPIGWAKERGYTYAPPRVLKQQGLPESEVQHILESALKEAEEQNLPSDIFKDQLPIREHKFKRSMKLEAVSPISDNHIGPATVVEVMDGFYFVVEMDNLEEKDPEKKIRFCCHSASPTIFPIQWTAFKGIKLTVPKGWPKPDFNWAEYLNQCRAMAAPETCFVLHVAHQNFLKATQNMHSDSRVTSGNRCKTDKEGHEFERGMKLEAVNPENPNQICAATITKIAAHLMWVHLDSSARIVASHVEHVSSHSLFPVGWCESNGYQLCPPHRTGFYAGQMRRRIAVVQPEMADGNQARGEGGQVQEPCPKIYFNHKCFSGPHLSKGRIAQLPCSVGPGPLHLVMIEVLSMLINVAYKSSRVLREIQLDGPANRAMDQQILKAKYKAKSYRAVVEICRHTSQLEDFCRQVCIKLECCPNLISPHYVGDNCPENCSRLTKTKYTYYYGKKKRKIGRPPGGHTNLENGPKKPTKRRKRRRLGMVARKTHPGTEGDGKDPEGEEEEEEEEEEEGDDKMSETSDSLTADSSSSMAVSRLPDHKSHSSKAAMAAASRRLKRKYTHHIPPPSEIRTRGAKLPRYSFERRTHKKILLSPVPSGASGLRSKSVQLNPSKLRRSPSPDRCRPQSLSNGNPLLSRSLSAPFSLSTPSPSSLSIPCSSGGPFTLPPPYSPLPLEKNPLHWTVGDTVDFIKTTDCAHVAKIFREQEIDGQALLLLSLPTVQDHLDLKLGPAIKLCHQIQRVKLAYYTQFDTTLSNTL